jgi:hypothetical protein
VKARDFMDVFSSGFGLGFGGLFSLAVDSLAFLDELVCLPLTEGEGNNLENILLIRACISSSGCRNADL